MFKMKTFYNLVFSFLLLFSLHFLNSKQIALRMFACSLDFSPEVHSRHAAHSPGAPPQQSIAQTQCAQRNSRFLLTLQWSIRLACSPACCTWCLSVLIFYLRTSRCFSVFLYSSVLPFVLGLLLHLFLPTAKAYHRPFAHLSVHQLASTCWPAQCHFVYLGDPGSDHVTLTKLKWYRQWPHG